MVDCTNAEVKGALPDLIHGRLSSVDRATMSAHVESCAGCRAELLLLQQLRDSAPLAPRMDASRIASAILPYGGAALIRQVDRQPSAGSSWIRPLLAIAAVAAVAFVAIGSLSVLKPGDTTTATESSPASSAAAPSRSSKVAGAGPLASEVSAKPVIDSSVKPAQPVTTAPEVQVVSLSLVGGTRDLSESELESLLSSLEGIESLPSAEPQSVTHSVENFEDGT